MEVVLDNIRQAEGIIEDIMPLKNLLEAKLNLSRQVVDEKGGLFTWNKVMRICLIASLNLSDKRNIDDLDSYTLSKLLYERQQTLSVLCYSEIKI